MIFSFYWHTTQHTTYTYTTGGIIPPTDFMESLASQSTLLCIKLPDERNKARGRGGSLLFSILMSGSETGTTARIIIKRYIVPDKTIRNAEQNDHRSTTLCGSDTWLSYRLLAHRLSISSPVQVVPVIRKLVNSNWLLRRRNLTARKVSRSRKEHKV